ncbi:hypothetical protein CHS0354_039784 [Potamilus streckersoni]|uniref:XLF-like coiled-coil region domain-containing protein n=1 Tax=Potamilus streckersoni TaxID=2493646 RepID=A0AAE0S061_9BIVA|nr:hypothetical protein CHS0354_039784 [Potamilus streckersoni]
MIIPLMAMVSELKRRQRQLITIIKKKDREIEEYTSQTLVTIKRNYKTEPFVETAFEMSMIRSKDFVQGFKNCRTNTFNASGQDLYRQVMAINAWLERSPHDSDEENDSSAQNSSLEGARSPNALASIGSSQTPTSITGSKLSQKISFKSPKKVSPKTCKSPVLNTAEVLFPPPYFVGDYTQKRSEQKLSHYAP